MSTAHEVDLFDAETQEDWYRAYDLLREEARVYEMPGTGIFVLTRFDDVRYALRHPEIFANGRTSDTLLKTDAAKGYWAARGWQKLTPLGTNPPEHRHYRELVDPFFDARGAERVRPMIAGLIDQLLDGWTGRGEVEYVADFALPLPVEIITRILGFPVEDIPQLKVWSEAWVMPFQMNLSPDEEMYVAEQGVAFQRYINDLANERRTDPRDDVLTHLVHARLAGERPLEEWEIINIVDHLFIGGNETTTFALTSAMWLLLQNPAVEVAVRADPGRIPDLVEEALRLESPTQGLFRRVARDVEIGGMTIPAGSTVHLRYAAANRDPRTFECPAALDLDRPNKRRHVAFASGEHLCPGAELSRLEQVLAHEAVLRRYPSIRLSVRNDFRHKPGFILRALNELHIELGGSPAGHQAGREHP